MQRRPRDPEVINIGGTQYKLPQLNLGPRLIIIAILVLIVLLWFVRGGPSYTVSAGEEGIVLTFGKYTRTTPPGFHLKLPWPIQTVEKADIGEVKRIELGFRSPEQTGWAYESFADNPELLSEAQMLTGDENVVDCSMAVQYKIRNSREYLFNFEPGDVEHMLKAIAEAALRQAVGDHPITDVLTTGKDVIQNEIKSRMQELADVTGSGVSIQSVYLQDVQPPREVADAFRDVASAREERERIINEAKAYQSGMLPKAQGEAERLKLDAQGYKEARVAEAQGAVARFQAIAEQYELAPEITRARMYLEAMSELLPRTKLTIVDESVGVVNLRSLGGQSAPLPIAEPQQYVDPSQQGVQ